jgi:hypothetical protein
MADVSILHPVLGRSVKNGATDTCSTCGGTIPEDHVPLMLWSDDGNLMWVYCEKCDEPMFARMREKAK